MINTIAKTDKYVVEYDCGMLIIHRLEDRKHLALTGKGIKGQFDACLKTHTAEKVIDVFIKMGYKSKWNGPMYKERVYNEFMG